MRFIYKIKLKHKVVDGTHYDTVDNLTQVSEEDVHNINLVEAATSIFIYEKDANSFESIMAINDSDIVDSIFYMEFRQKLPEDFIQAFKNGKLFVSMT